jgi:hypothetical protein
MSDLDFWLYCTIILTFLYLYDQGGPDAYL